MAQRSATVFNENDIVTHYFLGDQYIVVSSGGYYTQVVTLDGTDISFPTQDLRLM